ncbi:MAG: 4Fe-4S dicluster domain-containing protein [Sneathiellaceae bacterium]
MTALPAPGPRRLGLVIDLDICVGCHACATACKSWNGGGAVTAPLTDFDPYGAAPDGVWLNRVHGFEVAGPAAPDGMTLHFPRSCLHCADAPCVTVCPTGASYKRADDGIVLVNPASCLGCKLCTWACPYGAREYDMAEGVMRKCTLCVDRLEDDRLPEAERQPACVMACPTRARSFGDLADPASEVSLLVAARDGRDLMPDLGYRPTNKYLPPRPRRGETAALPEAGAHGGAADGVADGRAVAHPHPQDAGLAPPRGFWRLVDRLLSL